MNTRTPKAAAEEQIDPRIIAAENAEAVVGSEEDVASDARLAPLRQGQNHDDDPLDGGTVRREPIQRSPQDDIRGAIASRFRRAAPEDERPFNGDMADTENLYGELGGVDEDEAHLTDEEIDARAELAERRAQDPTRRPKPTVLKENLGAEDDREQPVRMITRKVRGQDVTMSEEEWLDKATQVTAADSYLAESRAILDQAKEIKAGRASQDRQHPDGPTARGDDGLDRSDPVEQAQHPELSFKDVIQEIQYGDPDEAAAKLEKLVEARSKKTATATVSEGALQRSYDQDLAKSQKALNTFAEANADLAADKIAAMAIESGMYDLYKEDMLALGLDESQLPKSPKELANWHRFYRINGYEVRQTKDLLEASKEGFLTWRDGKSKPRQQEETPSRRPARIQVNVDRDQRRMAIPNQPQRAVVPRRDAGPTAPASRSDVVAGMRRARGQV
jgi:hypothetical protein